MLGKGLSQRVFLVVMSFLLIPSMFIFAFNIQSAKAVGTIYIRADGSIEPSDAPISTSDIVTYVLTGNVTSSGDGIIVERDNIIIEGNRYAMEGSGDFRGIGLTGRINVTIENVTVTNFRNGMELNFTNKTTICGNIITANSQNGIDFYVSPDNSIKDNNITDNNSGIELAYSSSGNSIAENEIRDNHVGIYLYYSSNNSINGNDVTSSSACGLCFDSSSNSSVVGNNITSNGQGVNIEWSSYENRFYHNRFINNTNQVYFHPSSANFWDDGYPSGGNYWSDCNGTDLYRGPYQNETGSDRIGDTPYVIDANNIDRYPLMQEWAPRSNETRIFVDPSSATMNLLIGDVFSVDMKIENIPDDQGLVGLQFQVIWNSSILEGVDMQEVLFTSVTPPNPPNIWILQLSASGGEAEYAVTWQDLNAALAGGYAPIYGNHTVTTIQFRVKGYGTTALDLFNTKLGDQNAEPIAHEAQDGLILIPRKALGDINADGTVNMKDVATAVLAFNSFPGQPRWNYHADLDSSGRVDTRDILIILLNYGKHE
jgi:parallel beta-helix repeat protein